MPESKSSKASLTHLRRRTVVGVLRAWRDVKDTARTVILPDEVRPGVPKEDIDALKQQMQNCLDAKGGEVTARAHTAELGRTYLSLTESGKMRFLALLAEKFDIDRIHLETAIDAYRAATKPTERTNAEAHLREALLSPRSRILRQFTDLPNGFKFLVDMRADLLDFSKKDSALKGLEYDLKSILSAWFDIGLLDMEEITWNSPAALLEKLIAYEAVHKIRSWDDLKNRLDADRKVYAFFHNKMPLEPLIFVQVAFVKGMSGDIQTLLDVESPLQPIEEADTAIFYSISNAQRGLAGISFGNFLIKRVVAELSRDFKQIKTFATLSPIPGFRGWLDPLLKKETPGYLRDTDEKILRALVKDKHISPEQALLNLLESDWQKDAKTAEALKPVLMYLCALYLTTAKKGGKPLDPVSNFHLMNGARLERINWLADVSQKGLKQSAGLMVNYYYKLSEIDENHEEFAAHGKIVTSRAVRAWL